MISALVADTAKTNIVRTAPVVIRPIARASDLEQLSCSTVRTNDNEIKSACTIFSPIDLIWYIRSDVILLALVNIEPVYYEKSSALIFHCR